MEKGKSIIRLLGSWKNANKLSGNYVVCFKYEYVLFLLSAVTARFINEMQAMMTQFRLIVRLI